MRLLLLAFFLSVCSANGTGEEAESASFSGVSLLQTHFLSLHLGRSDGAGAGASDAGDAYSSSRVQVRQAIEPIFYLHVPKCGSSFATAIAHLGCGDKIDKKMRLEEPGKRGRATQEWNQKCGDGRFARFESGHAPLDEIMSDQSLSKVVMMIREPKARISSGYIHNLHDCTPLQEKYNIKDQDGRHWQPKGAVDPAILGEYATCVHSCMTNMLIGRDCAYNHGEPSEEQQALDREEALARLPKLGFVGLTDQWDLSMCLWHAKFGGECLPAEFTNVRPAWAQYDGGNLSESFQMNDQAIYEKAAKLFAAELEKYGVTPDSCARTICPAVAHLLGGSSVSQEKGSSALLMKYTRDSLKALTWPGRLVYDED